MGGRYRAYPEYKNSGEEWLGDVPSHWEVIQIKHLSTVRRGASPRPIDDEKYFDDEGEYAWTRIADVTASEMYLFNAPQRLSNLGSSLSVKLEPSALFLSIAGTVGKPCISGIKACIHDGFVYFPDLKIPSKFLFYVFAGEQAYKGLGKFGTQLNLNTDTVGGIKIGCTESSQLEKIVHFLDHETAKIDTLIDKQQKLIKLLKEKRQAVISNAVTKGLNPAVPLKDSGVEWLGKVPEHWVVCRVKTLVKAIIDGPHFSPQYQDDGYMFISARNIKVDRWSLDDAKFISEEDFQEFNKRVQPMKGDVLLTKGGTTGIARAVDLDFPFQVWVHVAVLKTITSKVNPFFLAYCLNGKACYEQSQLLTRGATNNDLGLSRIANIVLAIPNIVEQNQLVDWLNRKCAKFDKLLGLAEHNVNLLQERRTALISAAVTGKIDVRNWKTDQTEPHMEATA